MSGNCWDLLELFRVPLVDLPVIASINRRQWDETEDFHIAGQQVWLSALYTTKQNNVLKTKV
jgi:CRISPR/Cas system-associated endonuclease Cas1